MVDPIQVWEGDGRTPLGNPRTGVCRVCFDCIPLRMTMCERCKHSYDDCPACDGAGHVIDAKGDKRMCPRCSGQGFICTVKKTKDNTIPELG